MNTPHIVTGTEAAVIADIAARQAKGIAKYGVTVRDNPLELRDWLQHQYEELLDAAVYAKRAMEELDRAAQNFSNQLVATNQVFEQIPLEETPTVDGLYLAGWKEIAEGWPLLPEFGYAKSNITGCIASFDRSMPLPPNWEWYDLKSDIKLKIECFNPNTGTFFESDVNVQNRSPL